MNGIRYATPPISIKLWLQMSHKVAMEYIVKVTKINPIEIPYSSIGMKFFKDGGDEHIICGDFFN